LKSDSSNVVTKSSIAGETSSTSSVQRASPVSDAHGKASKASLQKENPSGEFISSKTSMAREEHAFSTKRSNTSVNTSIESSQGNLTQEVRPYPSNSPERGSVTNAPPKDSKTVLESLACVGVQFSSTDSGNNIQKSRRSTEIDLKDNASNRSLQRQSIELFGSNEILSGSFELKGR